MKPFISLAVTAISVGPLFVGSSFAQTCQTVFTKGGGVSTVGCDTPAPMDSASANSFGAGTILAPTVVAPPPITPLQPIGVSQPPILEPTVNIPTIEPITNENSATFSNGNDFFFAGFGPSAALLGRGYTYNGVGTTASDTFGNSLNANERILGYNGGLGARFDSFFVRGNGFYGTGKDSWRDPSSTLAAINGSSFAMNGPFDVAYDGNMFRGSVAAGYSFDIGAPGLTADVGPTATFGTFNSKLTSTAGANTVIEDTTVSTTALGATAGLTLAPNFNNDLSVWGHAAVQGYYALGKYTASQALNGGTALTQSDLVTAGDAESNRFTFGGELSANAGYRVSDTLSLGAGAYVNYLNDFALLDGHKLDYTSLTDFGLRASITVGF